MGSSIPLTLYRIGVQAKPVSFWPFPSSLLYATGHGSLLRRGTWSPSSLLLRAGSGWGWLLDRCGQPFFPSGVSLSAVSVKALGIAGELGSAFSPLQCFDRELFPSIGDGRPGLAISILIS